MRAYILTENERDIIRYFLEQGIEVKGIGMLQHRIKKNLPTINEDLEMIQYFKKKSEEIKR